MKYEMMNLIAEISKLISNDCRTFMEMETYNMQKWRCKKWNVYVKQKKMNGATVIKHYPNNW